MSVKKKNNNNKNVGPRQYFLGKTNINQRQRNEWKVRL